MSTPKVSLGFANLPDAKLDAFTENVLRCLSGSTVYPTPVPPLTVITTALTGFTTALAAAAGGGKAATAAKNDARENLVGLLRQSATYVQSNCRNDLALLLASGFDAISTNHTPSQLETPAIQGITNGTSTQLTLNVQSILNAKSYEVRQSTTPNTWQTSGIFTQARHIVVEALTPGTVYTFQVRAVGGSTGYSDWSDPVSHMAT